MKTSPTDAEALAALQTLRAWLGGAAAAATVYSQANLPPDSKSVDAYRRRHRSLRKAQVPGVWSRGKTLACTAEAWATELPKTRAPVAAVAPVRAPDASEAIDQALGIRVRRTA